VKTRRSVVGKSVLITGAARGIGAATAAELARRGARVSLIGLEPELLARNVEMLGDRHMWVEADVTDQAALDAAVSATVDRFGGVDVVIANAGVANLGTVRTADPDEAARTIEVNLIGPYRTAAATVGHLADRRGYLLIVASVASFTPLPGGSAYAASKAGVESLSASLRLELAQYGITVGSVHPSWTDTDMLRLGEEDFPTATRMRTEMPWPANTLTAVEDCAAMIADAVEWRALRTYVPKSGAFLSVIRPLLFSGRGHRRLARRAGADLRQLDAENEARGAVRR
jgi:NAD(P)-dependent dehydrogenase (short-subunit alcohol dehydrogenase family)